MTHALEHDWQSCPDCCAPTPLHRTQAARRQWNLEKAALHQVKLPLPAPGSQQLQDRSRSGTDTPPASPTSQQLLGQSEGRQTRFQPGQRAPSPPAGPPQHGPAPATEAEPFSSQSAEPRQAQQQQQQQHVHRQPSLGPLRLSSASQADEAPPQTSLQPRSAASPAGSPRSAQASPLSQPQAAAHLPHAMGKRGVQDSSTLQAGQRDQQGGRSSPPAAPGSPASQPRSEAQPEQQPAHEGTAPRQAALAAAAAQAGRSPQPSLQAASLQPGTSSREPGFQPESLPHEQVGSQMLEAGPAAGSSSGQSQAGQFPAASHQPEGPSTTLSSAQPAQPETATQRQAGEQHAAGPELAPAPAPAQPAEAPRDLAAAAGPGSEPAQPAAELPTAPKQAAAMQDAAALAGFGRPSEQPGPQRAQPQHDTPAMAGQGEGPDSLAQPLEDGRNSPRDDAAQSADVEPPQPSASISEAIEQALPQHAADPEQGAQLLSATMPPDQDLPPHRQAASEPEHEQRVLMPCSTHDGDRLPGASGQLDKQAAQPGLRAEADSESAAPYRSSAQRMPSQPDAASHSEDQAEASAKAQSSLPLAQQPQHEEHTARGIDQVTLLAHCGCPALIPATSGIQRAQS